MQCVCTFGALEMLDIQNDMHWLFRAFAAELPALSQRSRACSGVALRFFEEFGKYCTDEYRLATDCTEWLHCCFVAHTLTAMSTAAEAQ